MTHHLQARTHWCPRQAELDIRDLEGKAKLFAWDESEIRVRFKMASKRPEMYISTL